MFNPTLDTLRHKGFGGETYTRILRPERLAQDAALVTAPNMGVPAELTTFFDPEVVTILTAARRAREITDGREVQKGDATTVSAKFPVLEYTGHTEPYNDFANGGKAGINANWVARDNYLFSTTRRYGDLEEARNALAKVKSCLHNTKRRRPPLSTWTPTASTSGAWPGCATTGCSTIRLSMPP